jgi:hypothetical protein
MKKFKLKTQKIRAEMKRLGYSERILAIRIKPKTSPQLLNYWLRSGSLAGVHRIAEALDIDPKDLIC